MTASKVAVAVAPGVRADRAYARRVVSESLRLLSITGSEVSVLLTDDAGIRELNRAYRSKDKPTDVLSFPMGDAAMLGDVVVSVETAAAQAREFGVTMRDEVARLLVHGLLHLLGYDHVKGGRQAKRMKEKEEELLAALRRARKTPSKRGVRR